ncbi:MAG: hypothetical protein ABIO60_05355 [Aquaticitalea sp.]
MKSNSNLFLFSCSTLFLLFLPPTAQGQNINEKYLAESIYLKGNYKYVKNGVTYRIGFLGQKLKKEMTVSPNAVMEFKKYDQKRKAVLIMSSVALALYGTGLLMDKESTQTGLFIGGLGLSLVSIPLSSSSEKNLQKAIWIRNGDILH